MLLQDAVPLWGVESMKLRNWSLHVHIDSLLLQSVSSEHREYNDGFLLVLHYVQQSQYSQMCIITLDNSLMLQSDVYYNT